MAPSTNPIASDEISMCVATLTELTQPLQNMKVTGDTKTKDLYWGIIELNCSKSVASMTE